MEVSLCDANPCAWQITENSDDGAASICTEGKRRAEGDADFTTTQSVCDAGKGDQPVGSQDWAASMAFGSLSVVPSTAVERVAATAEAIDLSQNWAASMAMGSLPQEKNQSPALQFCMLDHLLPTPDLTF